MVSDITVVLAQEIFMDLICTIYRHCGVSDTFKKTPHSRRVYSSAFELHQSNTLYWVSPLKGLNRVNCRDRAQAHTTDDIRGILMSYEPG